MSSVLRSQGLVLATAVAVSGTVFLLTLYREKNLPATPLFGISRKVLQPAKKVRSCLSSGGKNRERNKKKRVKFADDVKDSFGNGEVYRREHKKLYEIQRKCGREISPPTGMPGNRVALYNGMLRDRVRRTEEYSF